LASLSVALSPFLPPSLPPSLPACLPLSLTQQGRGASLLHSLYRFEGCTTLHHRLHAHRCRGWPRTATHRTQPLQPRARTLWRMAVHSICCCCGGTCAAAATAHCGTASGPVPSTPAGQLPSFLNVDTRQAPCGAWPSTPSVAVGGAPRLPQLCNLHTVEQHWGQQPPPPLPEPLHLGQAWKGVLL
jgi:hypothetical protein